MLAYNFDHSTNPKTVDEFANDLSLSLIFNAFDGYVPENEQRRLSSDSKRRIVRRKFEYVNALCCSFQC